MEKTTAICTCSKCGMQFAHTAVKETPAQANAWKAWAEQYVTTCPACKAASKQESNNTSLYPDLLGSPKQIAWAMRLRRNFVDYLRARLYQWDANQLEAFISWIVDTKITASWWIDELGHGDDCRDDVAMELTVDWTDAKATGVTTAHPAAQPQPEKLYEDVTMPYQQFKAGYRHCTAVPGTYDADTKTIVVRIPV